MPCLSQIRIQPNSFCLKEGKNTAHAYVQGLSDSDFVKYVGNRIQIKDSGIWPFCEIGSKYCESAESSPNTSLLATGVTCRQGTLTPPDTWSRSIWDLHMFYLLRPILFPNLSLFSGLCTSIFLIIIDHKVEGLPIWDSYFLLYRSNHTPIIWKM